MLKAVFAKINLTELDKASQDAAAYFEYWINRLNLDLTSNEKHTFNSASEAMENLRRCVEWNNKPSSLFGRGNNRIPLGIMRHFGDSIRRIVDTDEFQRLRNIKQLGLVHYAYPGAVHTRFEHSLGTFEAAIKYLNIIVKRSAPRFRGLISEAEIAMTASLALLHDVGHYPFAHVVNEAKIPGFPPHEFATYNILANGLGKIVADELNFDEKEYLRFIKFCFHIESIKLKDIPITWHALRDIVSGPIDADKYDYLRRDAHHAGVQYASSLDPDRFLDSCQRSFQSEPISVVKSEPLGPHDWLISTSSFPTFPRSL